MGNHGKGKERERGEGGESNESIVIKITRARGILRRFVRSLCTARNDYAQRSCRRAWEI